jgi:predicted transcriptional regulator
MAKRRRVEILASVLHSAVAGAKKTRIMQNANLNHSLLVKYLEESTNLGFLQFASDSYLTTEKGMRFLEVYTRFSSKYSRLDDMMKASQSDWKLLEQMCDLTNNCSSKSTGDQMNQLNPRAEAEEARRGKLTQLQ